MPYQCITNGGGNNLNSSSAVPVPLTLNDVPWENDGRTPRGYRSLIHRAASCLNEAHELDAEYGGDILAEGVREGLLHAALSVLGQLAIVCEQGR